MAGQYVKDLTAGQQVADQAFLVVGKQLRTARNGSKYVELTLSDRTGQLCARMWQASQQDFEQIPEGGFLRLTGRCESYKGTLQLIVDGFRPVEAGALEVADFLPQTGRDVEQMWQQMLAILRTIRNRWLLELIKQFVKDEELVERFKKAPAAVERHHAYLGGLLEHTLKVMELVRAIGPLFEQLDKDVLLAGAFLHDVGKVAELEYERGFGYSDDGQLVGHIVRGVVWIEQKAAAVEAETGRAFPERLKLVLQHMVISHHGEQQYGSPKVPATAEALALNYLDDLDAKLQQVFEHIASDPDAASDWTGYVRSLQTRLYKKGPAAEGEQG